jgi:hypothetical protein
MVQGMYSQHFIFFLICEWAQLASVIFYKAGKAGDKLSSLLGPFIKLYLPY